MHGALLKNRHELSYSPVGRNKSARAIAGTGVSGKHYPELIRRKRHLALRYWVALFRPTYENLLMTWALPYSRCSSSVGQICVA